MIRLIGVVIIVVGFALKLDAILIVLVAGLATGLVGGLSIGQILDIFGANFVANRNMGIFIIIMLVTGTLERNGLQEVAARLIARIKNATAGLVIAAYGILRVILAAFNIGLGGVAGFVRPVVLPMAEGAVEASEEKLTPEYSEEIKGMASGMENITWFFGQVLFIGGSGALLVQSTLGDLGYDVHLLTMAKTEIPVALAAFVFAAIYYYVKDKRLRKKYYHKENKR